MSNCTPGCQKGRPIKAGRLYYMKLLLITQSQKQKTNKQKNRQTDRQTDRHTNINTHNRCWSQQTMNNSSHTYYSNVDKVTLIMEMAL